MSDLKFELDKEVQIWCRAVHRFGWNRQARIAELADHLYCEIEQLQAAGLSAEVAFRTATEQLGDVAQLQSEHIKNATLLSLLYTQAEQFAFATLKSGDRPMTPKRAALYNILVSLFFAAAIILASYLIADTQYEHHAQTVTYLLIALWFVPFTWLSAAEKDKSIGDSIKCDWALIKRKFSRLVRSKS
ncbi:MAG: permease prefix domain 1-containing protein [Caldilineaceae bacterium]